MKKIAIVTDSNSGITQEMGKTMGIHVIPMPFFIDGELFLEDITLTQEEFYKRLGEDSDISTSQPSPGEVMECWDELLKEYDEIVHIPMSSGLSSTLPCWDWNASRRSWNCLICWLSANKTCRDDAATFDCLATRLRDFMFPAISAKASHGRHNCTHASYGFLPNIMDMAMPKLRSSLHSQTINQDDKIGRAHV